MEKNDRGKISCCKDVLKNVFELNDFDVEVYKKLRDLREAKADELAKKVNKERSTTYRSLQRLTSSGFCNKKTKTLESGGYYHIYTCNDSKQVKKEIESCLDEWYRSMKEALNNFDKEMI